MLYMSSRFPGVVKTLSPETLEQVRMHVLKTFPNGIMPTTKLGEIQDCLLDFRYTSELGDEQRLMINQLAPIYLALCWGEPI